MSLGVRYAGWSEPGRLPTCLESTVLNHLFLSTRRQPLSASYQPGCSLVSSLVNLPGLNVPAGGR